MPDDGSIQKHNTERKRRGRGDGKKSVQSMGRMEDVKGAYPNIFQVD